MNRELIRLLVYLQSSSIMDRYFDYLKSDAPESGESPPGHATCGSSQSGWTTERKMELFQFLAEAKKWDGGSSYPLYLGNAARDMAKNLTLEESLQILPHGAELTDAALGALVQAAARNWTTICGPCCMQLDAADRPAHGLGQQAADGRYRGRPGPQR